MHIISLVWGILAGIGMMIGFVPCLGWFNWLNIPFAMLGLIVCMVSLVTAREAEAKSFSIAGLSLCATAIFLGGIRLIIGAGLL
jgi:hypothetical protein